MTKQIPVREWEAISAYLDKQLSEKERVRLEARLKTSPELQFALEEMRQTRALLRSQPRLKAPRNFTLTPEMVGRKAKARPEPRSYLFFRFASAMATMLLVFVLLGDLFTGAPQTATQTAMRGVTGGEVEMALEVAPTLVAQEEAVAGAASAEGEVEAPAAAEPEAGIAAAEVEEESPAAVLSAPADAQSRTKAAEEEQPAAEDTALLDEPQAVPEEAAEGMGALEVETDAGSRQGQGFDQQAGEQDRQAPFAGYPDFINTNTLRAAEIILLALAVAAGVAAYAVRKAQ
jgi:hypothetical protein